MVLDGLEDNDDFWNVVPSDDEISIVDSSQGHLDMGVYGCRNPQPRCPQTDDKTKDTQDTIQSPRVFNTDKREYCDTSPEMLPNGRYRYQSVYAVCYLLHCKPSGVTIPARISQPAGICGVSRSILFIQLTRT